MGGSIQKLMNIFLWPGDVACSQLGLRQTEHGDLVRMLVNSLAWTLLGIVVVVMAV